MSTEQTTLTEPPAEAELVPDPPPIDATGAAEEPSVIVIDKATGEIVPAQQQPPDLGGAASMVPYNPHSVSLSDIAGIARTLAKSGYFQDAGDASKAFAKILAGQELGIGPFRSLKEVRIIQGAPTLSAGATAALIKASTKYDYREVERTDDRCILDFFEAGEKRGQVTWTMQDADRAGLIKPGSGWSKYPRRMLFARAITEGATTYCADIFGGAIYTPDELGEPVE